MDADTRDRLILDNMKLVWSISRFYYSRGADRRDLFQSGCIGLINGVDRFDEKLGLSISTVLYPYIKNEIWNCVVSTNWRTIHLGDNDEDVVDDVESTPDYCIDDFLKEFRPLDVWIVRRLFGIPDPPGSIVRVLSIKGKRRSLPVHQKEPWSVTQISKKTGLTRQRIREIKQQALLTIGSQHSAVSEMKSLHSQVL
jgi:RNA polymerase sigma factor (sigma-70 family)